MAAGYVISDIWLAHFLDRLTGYATPGTDDFTLHLFVNDVTIDDTIQDTDDLTEASWTGYTALSLSMEGFGPAAVTAHIAKGTAPSPFVFDADPGASTQTVYGYYVTDADDDLVYAESFSVGTIVTEGGQYRLTPSMRLKTCRD